MKLKLNAFSELINALEHVKSRCLCVSPIILLPLQLFLSALMSWGLTCFSDALVYICRIKIMLHRTRCPPTESYLWLSSLARTRRLYPRGGQTFWFVCHNRLLIFNRGARPGADEMKMNKSITTKYLYLKLHNIYYLLKWLLKHWKI